MTSQPHYHKHLKREEYSRNRKIKDFVTLPEKGELRVDGKVKDFCYTSLQLRVFENLVYPWKENDGKHFFGGGMSAREYTCHMAGAFNTPTLSRTQVEIFSPQGFLIVAASIV